MKENTFAKLGQIIDELDPVTFIVLNGKELTMKDLEKLNYGAALEGLVHIDEIKYFYNTEDYPCACTEVTYYVSDSWLPRYKTKHGDITITHNIHNLY